MSRFGNFVEIKKNEVKDLMALIEDFGVSIDIYETSISSGQVGYDTDVGTYVFKKRISALFDEKKEAQHINQDVGQTNKTTYVITTLEDEIIQDNRIRYNNKFYKVSKVNRAEDDIYQIEVQRIDE